VRRRRSGQIHFGVRPALPPSAGSGGSAQGRCERLGHAPGADPGGRRFPFVMHRPSRRAPSTPPSAGAASRSRPNGPFFGGWGVAWSRTSLRDLCGLRGSCVTVV